MKPSGVFPDYSQKDFARATGWKQDGDDGKTDISGKPYTKVRKTVPTPGRVNYKRTLPSPPPPDPDAEEVEVYFAFRGNYVRVNVLTNETQEEIEKKGGNQFQGNLCLTDFRSPTEGVTYRNDTAAWIVCKRNDTADEEWDLFGQELTDEQITHIMEDRWYVPLKKVKPKRPLENNSIIMFEK
jgi:hypothetical protein